MYLKKYMFRICSAVVIGVLLFTEITLNVKADEVAQEAVQEESQEILAEAENVEVNDENLVGTDGEEFVFGDFKFRQVDANNLCVLEYLGSSSSITIPWNVTGSGRYGIVTSIGDNFLYNKSVADRITSVTIPKYIVDIGKNAFRECKNLATVTFEKVEIKETFGDDTNSYRAYKSDLRTIGDHAFAGDTKLTSIDLSPQGIELIDDYAFSGCSGIQTLKLAKTIGYIGYNAFLNCNGLNEIYYESELDAWANITYGKDAYGNESAGSHPNYYSPVTYFFELKRGWGNEIISLKYYEPVSFNINSKVSEIGCYVFYNFRSLMNGVINGPTLIGSYAFGNCTSLSDVEIHNTATTLGDKIFYGCSNLWYVRVHQNTVIETKMKEQRGKDGANTFNIEPMSDDGCGDGSQSGGEGPGTGGEDPGEEPGVDPGEDPGNNPDPNASQVDKLYTLAGYSLTYDGSIGLRYFFTVDSSVTNLSSAKAMFKIPDGNNGHTNTEVTFDKLEKYDSYYIYTVNIAPKDVDSIIYVQVTDGSGNKGTENKISCYSYLIGVENKYSNQSDQGYAAQMILRYCDACQHYFDYHEGSISESYMWSSSYYENVTCDSKYKATMTDSRFIGFSMLLDNNVSFRLYFKGKVTLAGWETISTIDYCDGYTTYTISGLQFGGSYKDGYKKANSFNRKIAYKDQSNTLNTMWCVYSYLYSALQSSNSDAVYLAKVMLAVDEWFPYVATRLEGTGAYVLN